MKIPKQRYDYLVLIYLPLLIGGMLLGWLFTKPLTYFISLSFTALLIGAIILALSPLGKYRIPTFNSALIPKYWLLRLMLIQLGMLLMSLPTQQLFPATGQTNFTPTYWPLYLLLAIAFAYFAAQKKTTPLVDTSLRTLFHHKLNGIFGVSIDMAVKYALFTICAFTISAGIIGIMDGRGLNFSNLLLGILLCLAINNNRSHSTILSCQRMLASRLDKEIMQLPLFLLLTITFLLLFIVIFSLLNKLFTGWLPHIQPSALQLLNQQFLENNLAEQLLSFGWWLGWAPLIAGLIAHLLQGKTIRLVIFSGLLLPLLFMFSGRLINPLLNNPHGHWLFAILSLILACTFMQDSAITRLIAVTSAQKNRVARIPLSSVRSLLALTITIFVICLFTGTAFISLFLFSGAIPSFMVSLTVIWALLKTYLKSRHPPLLGTK